MEWYWNYFNTLKLLRVELNFQQESSILLWDFWSSRDESQAKQNKTMKKAKKERKKTLIAPNLWATILR